MTFTEWSNNRKKQKENEASQTAVYEADSLRSSGISSSFEQWSNAKQSKEAEMSVAGWLNASKKLLTEVQTYYKNWNKDDVRYRNFQDSASSLLSTADSWRKQYAGNDEAIAGINSVVSSLSKLKEYAMKRHDYYSHWDTEEDYNTDLRYAGYYREYGDLSYEKIKEKLYILPAGEEREWLTVYAPTVMTPEDYDHEISSIEGELTNLYAVQEEYDHHKMRSGDIGSYSYNRLMELKKQYGGRETIDNLIAEKEAELKQMKNTKGTKILAFVSNNEDFDEYKGYVSTESDSGSGGQFGMHYDDLKYEYINGAANGMRSEIDEKSSTWDGTITHQFGIYAHMNPDEISVYNYHYAKHGKERAEEYLDSISSTLEARSNDLLTQRIAKFAADHEVLSSAFSIASKLASAAEYVADLADYGIEKIKGNPYASLGTNQAALTTNTIRSTVADQVDWEIGNWDAFDFLYNTAMSGLDSLAAGTLFGGFGGAVLGLAAAAQGTNDALNRGMSDGQAFWSGLFSGVFEGLFETISIGQFKSLKEVSPKNIKDLFKNLEKSMLVNSSEEMLTEIANIGYDTLVNGEFANYTLEELKSGAWKDALWQVLESGGSGFLIGTGMSAAGSAYSYANQQARYADTGETITATDGGMDAVLNYVNEGADISPAQVRNTLISQIDELNQSPSDRKAGQLAENVQAAGNQANVPVNPEAVAQSLMNKGFNPETSAEIADAVAARLNGQELTKAQRNILSSATNSPSVQSVISDMQKVQKGSPKLLAGNIGKSTETVQPINNQADVAQSLRNKGINSQKADSIAEAITARLNGQELTKPQRDILRSALESPTVQSVVSEFMQKKTDGVDSTHHNGYDEVNASEVNEAMVNSGSYQDQEAFFNGSYEADSEIRKFNSWDDMKDTYKGTITQFIKENKPKYSPEIKKWFDNGGSIEVRDSDGKKIWIYTSSEGVSVPYIDGYIKFPDAYLHSTIKPIDIGEFTGDRGKDVEKMLPILQADYGIDEIPDGYTVHHDIVNGILQLVDESVHTEFTHIGGYSIYK